MGAGDDVAVLPDSDVIAADDLEAVGVGVVGDLDFGLLAFDRIGIRSRASRPVHDGGIGILLHGGDHAVGEVIQIEDFVGEQCLKALPWFLVGEQYDFPRGFHDQGVIVVPRHVVVSALSVTDLDAERGFEVSRLSYYTGDYP